MSTPPEFLQDIVQRGITYREVILTLPEAHEDGQRLLAFFHTRGITSDQISRWGLGMLPPEWAGEHCAALNQRLLIPIRDAHYNLVSVSGRALFPAQEPKFWHFPFNKRHVLWGLGHLATRIEEMNFAFLVESYFDVLALERCGFPAVAFMGSSLAIDQAALLARYTQRVCYIAHRDKADPGVVERQVLHPLRRMGMKAVWVTVSHGSDFDEYYRLGGHEHAVASAHEAFRLLQPRAPTPWKHRVRKYA